MTGRIVAISGPTVTVDLKVFKLYDMVRVGEAMLISEVVRLEQERAVVQVYEDTRGLGVHEPARGLDTPLTARLGPGLLSGMFDGLQRPMERLFRQCGPFICSGSDIYPLELERPWRFFPLRRVGEEVAASDIVGYVEEGAFRHPLTAGASGAIGRLEDGEFNLTQPVGAFADGREITAIREWPVRKPRPYRRKLSPALPLVTGQRAVDFLFPLARGGTAVFPGGFGTGKTVLEQAVAKFSAVDLVV